MKTLFIEARYVGRISVPQSLIKKLPKRIGLITSIQFIGHLKKIQEQLRKHSVKAYIGKGLQPYPGQVLGCDVSSAFSIIDMVDAFLCISSGEFHPLGMAFNTIKPIIVFNPITKKFHTIDKKEIETFKKRKRGAYLKFLHATNIGLLVSIKPGQNNLRIAFKLKEKLQDKNCFIFVGDEIEKQKLVDFNFIECWVNLACPRIDDMSMLNIEDIKKLVFNVRKVGEIVTNN